MRGVILLAIVGCALAAADVSKGQQSRVIQEAAIGDFPFLAALLGTTDSTNYQHRCAGSILNNRAVLTAGRCVLGEVSNKLRFRVGSTSYSSGGTVYQVTAIIENEFDEWSNGWDIAIVHTSIEIVTSANIQPGTFAGANYNLADLQAVTTAGWGRISMPLWVTGEYDQLRALQHLSLPSSTCAYHNSMEGFAMMASQICSGFIDPSVLLNPVDKCHGEPGAPLVHNGVVVGIRSFAIGCNNPEKPTVSTRVGSYIDWISANA